LLFHRLDWAFLSFIRKTNIPLKGILAPATSQQDSRSTEKGSGNETTADNCQQGMHRLMDDYQSNGGKMSTQPMVELFKASASTIDTAYPFP
jgi:hypothetical protein